MIAQFIEVPAESDARGDPAAGDMVQRRKGLARVMVGLYWQRRGGQPDPSGYRCRGGQVRPRIQGAHVPVVGSDESPVCGGRRRGGVGMCTCSGVVEAKPRLPRSVAPGRFEPAVTGELYDAELHQSLPDRCLVAEL